MLGVPIWSQPVSEMDTTHSINCCWRACYRDRVAAVTVEVSGGAMRSNRSQCNSADAPLTEKKQPRVQWQGDNISPKRGCWVGME